MLSLLAPIAISTQTRVRLRVGLWYDRTRELDASLRALSGAEEESLGEGAPWVSPAELVSTLLTRTVLRIGNIAPVSINHARALTVLDRDLLLIGLRQLHFGDRIDVTVTCPNGACGKKIDLNFRLSDLPVPDCVEAQPVYELDIAGKRISYRLPNGGDQELAAGAFVEDPAGAQRAMLARCILAIDGAPASSVDALTPEQQVLFEEEMERRDPQIENGFDALCPECGETFRASFDIQDFLLRELAGTRADLFRQVHTLAWYYHWSEAEIMALPFSKRKMYLNLLAETFGEPAEALP